MLKYVETNKAPAAIGPYSQGIVVNGTAFFSGQIPLSPETGEVIGTTIREQTEQVMKNIQGLLESQNASFTDVVKTTCFLADMSVSWLRLQILLHSTKYMQNILQENPPVPASP